MDPELDHRLLGPRLGLFHQQDNAPGTVFWHENGTTLWLSIEQYIRSLLSRNGYVEVRSPQLVQPSLFAQSGHLDKFADGIIFAGDAIRSFAGSEMREGDSVLFRCGLPYAALKPMNCPCHVQIFNKKTRSYRDLPYRMAEFGACMRNEPPGSLHGLMRLRAFTQDDAHIFCTEGQIASEVRAFNDLLFTVYRRFGFEDVQVSLSTRPEKFIGSIEQWDRAEESLRDVLSELPYIRDADERKGEAVPPPSNPMANSGLRYIELAGEGAFYGPKIEYSIKDSQGRGWQLGTIQLDFNLPDRLGARYIGEDNREHTPVMLHRAILGSIERFIAILIEHYKGALPYWIAPVQAVVCPVSNKFDEYAKKVKQELQLAGVRVQCNLSSDRVGSKIRDAELQKVPYILVVGAKEQAESTVSVRQRGVDGLNTSDLPSVVRSLSCR